MMQTSTGVTMRSFFTIMMCIILAAAIESLAAMPPQKRQQQGGTSNTRRWGESGQIHKNRILHPRQELAAADAHHDGRQLVDSNELTSMQLRSDLLNNYDRVSYPFNRVWNTTSTSEAEIRKGLTIEVNINFHKVFNLDVTNSVVDLVVWVQQRWNDPRLAWDPAEYGGIQKAWFWIGGGSGAGGETSEIWTPDLELWNMEESISTSLTDTLATVSSDGSVFWSRPGHIKPVCKFRGLAQFPFDSLGCTMEIGSWSYSGLYIRPVRMNGIGFTMGGSETAGESFAEYSLEGVESEEHIYPPYASAPSEDWPVVFYHMTFDRAWEPYVRGYLVLQILLNLAAFCCFWIPPHVGERMSLAITALLAAVASELVVSANLPAAGDATWFSKFSMVSLCFAAAALFESAVVIYFYFKTTDDLIPLWVKVLRRKLKQKGREDAPTRDNRSASHSHHTSVDDEHKNKEQSNDIAYQADREEAGIIDFINDCPEDDFDSADGLNQARQKIDMKLPRQKQKGFGVAIKTAVDRNTDDFKNAKETHHTSDDDEHEIKEPFNDIALHREDFDGAELKQSRQKMVRQTAFREALETVVGRNAEDFKNSKETENNVGWQKVAVGIDSFSRVFFPVAYAVFLGAMFSRSGK